MVISITMPARWLYTEHHQVFAKACGFHSWIDSQHPRNLPLAVYFRQLPNLDSLIWEHILTIFRFLDFLLVHSPFYFQNANHSPTLIEYYVPLAWLIQDSRTRRVRTPKSKFWLLSLYMINPILINSNSRDSQACILKFKIKNHSYQ